MLWREMQSRKQEEENRRGIKGLFVFLNYLLREDFFLRLSFASLLWSPARSKTKKRSHANFRFAWLLFLFKMLFLHFRYSVYSSVRVFVESPIYLIIGQGAVNTSTHDQPTILQDFLPCFLLALCNNIEYSVKDILRSNSVNFLLHNLKIQPLTICIPLALRWIICGV